MDWIDRVVLFFKESYQTWMDYPLREGVELEASYRIERVLGMGSYGVTYLGRYIATGETHLLKHNKPSKGEVGIKLLEQELYLMQLLDHPGIPRIHGHFHAKGRYFIVTDYVEGRTLEQLIFEDGVQLSEKACLHWVLKLMGIVSYVHSRGIVHLDLRIPNVIVRGDQLYLIDFGLARKIGSPSFVEQGDEETRISRPAEITSDLNDIGHFLLFLLYSSFNESLPSSNSVSAVKDKSWQEELTLSVQTKHLLERLLGISVPYPSSSEFLDGLRNTISELEKESRSL